MNVPKKNIINYAPTIDDTRRFQSKIVPFHTMYIMADLSTALKYYSSGFISSNKTRI